MIVTVSGTAVQCHVWTKVNIQGFQSKIGWLVIAFLQYIDSLAVLLLFIMAVSEHWVSSWMFLHWNRMICIGFLWRKTMSLDWKKFNEQYKWIKMWWYKPSRVLWLYPSFVMGMPSTWPQHCHVRQSHHFRACAQRCGKYRIKLYHTLFSYLKSTHCPCVFLVLMSVCVWNNDNYNNDHRVHSTGRKKVSNHFGLYFIQSSSKTFANHGTSCWTVIWRVFHFVEWILLLADRIRRNHGKDTNMES